MEDGSARRLGADAFVSANEVGDKYTEFEGKWLHIDGTPVAVELISATDSMITCSTRIFYDNYQAYLLLGFDRQKAIW